MWDDQALTFLIKVSQIGSIYITHPNLRPGCSQRVLRNVLVIKKEILMTMDIMTSIYMPGRLHPALHNRDMILYSRGPLTLNIESLMLQSTSILAGWSLCRHLDRPTNS